MSRSIDMTGKRFGRLTCIKNKGTNKNRVTMWECECDCGNTVVVLSTSLRNGSTQSCGCLQKEAAVISGKRRLKHGFFKEGLCDSGVYKSWSHMKQRCLNENDKDYHNYGGRGITVCDEWISFENFYRWSIENGFKKGLSIERVDNDGNYEPSNCVWATKKVQNNNRRNCKKITYKDQVKTLSEWSENLGISYKTLLSRLGSGWTVEKTFSTPVRKKKQ